MKLYKNSKRPTGSQSEIPTIKIATSPKLTITIGGYQIYTLTSDGVTPRKYGNKFKYIADLLKNSTEECGSVADLGCSNGLVCFTALHAGYDRILALDHDEQCLEVIRRASAALQTDKVAPTKYSFGEPFEPTDIVIAGALIHWVFSCTAAYGSFDKIFEYLRSHTKKMLVIEWVAPNDGAIRFFKHTSYNKEVVKEAYTQANFLKSLNKYFSDSKLVLKVTPTRLLYVAHV
jgi:trans-aconitate methyltransferase